MNIVCNFKCDNAGEFLSREFRKMLTDKGIHQTIYPPHVHQLNGVADRARHPLRDGAGSGKPGREQPPRLLWAYAAANHAADVLNRTAGPPDSDITSYEVMTDEQPKVMGILPFGCRVHVVRPKEYIRKGHIDAHA